MVSPFFKIRHKVQEDHILLRDDVLRISELSSKLDPRVIHYVKKLNAHKRVCPICSWPRLYPFIRKMNRVLRTILLRKVW